MIKKDLIILVIANHNEYYTQMINYYWKKLIKYSEINHQNIKIYLLFGNSYIEDNDLTNNSINFDLEENIIPNVLKKTILGIKEVNKKYEYKYLFRTNLSSFLIIKNLLNILNKFDTDEFVYAGVLGRTYVSGAGCLFNKNTICQLLKNEKKLNYTKIDDVSIFFLLRNIKRKSLTRMDFNNENKEKLPLIIKKIEDEKIYHLRCKINNNDRTDDINILKKLAEYFYSIN